MIFCEFKQENKYVFLNNLTVFILENFCGTIYISTSWEQDVFFEKHCLPTSNRQFVCKRAVRMVTDEYGGGGAGCRRSSGASEVSVAAVAALYARKLLYQPKSKTKY